MMMTESDRLRGLVAYCDQHVGDAQEDECGRSCDERGCGICNAGSSTEAALAWIATADAGEATLPPDEWLHDALEGGAVT